MRGFLKKAFTTVYSVFPVFNRPMAVCAVMSIIAVLYLNSHKNVLLSLLLLFVIVSAVICFVRRTGKAVVISLLFLAVCASAVNEFYRINELNRLDGQTVEAVFVAAEDTKSTEKVSKVTVYATGKGALPANTKLKLYWFDGTSVSCGDKFKAAVKLSSLKDSEYKNYNYGNAVYIDSRLIKIRESYKPNGFFLKIGKVRSYIVKTLNNRFSEDDSSVLIALNSGDRSFLSDTFYGKVLTCGVSHVMVVSGLHISIILGLLYRFIEKFFYNSYLKALSSIGILFLIAAMCGFSQSASRACLMFLFFVLAPVFMRQNDPLNSLGAAVILMVFIHPFCIFSVAFLLSVVSTAAVVWIAPFYSELIITKLHLKKRFAVTLIEIFTVSLSAMIFTAPISMLVFDRISFLAPFTFLLVTFPVTFALEFNTLALVLSAIPGIKPLSEPLFFVSGICTKYIRFVIRELGSFRFMYVTPGFGMFFVSLFLIFATVSGMYLYKFYRKLARMNDLKEVRQRGGNSERGFAEKKPARRAD